MNLLLLALLIGQDPAAAKASGPSLKLPPQVIVAPGNFIVVVAETNCKRLRWKCEGVNRVPPEHVSDQNKKFVAIAGPGTYRLEAEGSLNDEWVESACLVIVGQQPAPPIPPLPPPPGPPPVPPPTPWQAELQDLYEKDKDPQKQAKRDKLVSLWTGVSGAALKDPELTTVGAMTNKLHDCGTKYPYLLTDADLTAVRKRLAKEITDHVGAAATPMDDALRQKASKLFAEFVTALQSVK